MKHMTKKISAVLAVVFIMTTLFAAIPQTVSAVGYSGSSSYMSGPYYANLLGVNITGDQRADIVNVARSQVGYHESNSGSDLSGTSGGSGNCTEYGRWYGLQDAWCAMFVTWCARVAGISDDVIPTHAYTPNGLSWFQNRWQAASRAQVANGQYWPEAGDIVYFKSSSTSASASHIGIVTGYDGWTLYTIEGNTGNGVVAERSYAISNSYIVYVCRPDYANNSSRIVSGFDGYDIVEGGIRIRGWCYDESNLFAQLKLHVYFGDPVFYGNSDNTANGYRPDVDDVHHCGAYHGFDATLYTDYEGFTKITVFAVNEESGKSDVVSEFYVNIERNFKYSIDEFETIPGGVHVRGWCYDKRFPDGDLRIDTYIGGAAGDANTEGFSFRANEERIDVAFANGVGPYHGFDKTITTSKQGDLPIVIYAINEFTGEVVIIGLYFKTITSFNYSLDEYEVVPGGVYIRGWCYDARDTNQTLQVHVYFGGAAGDPNAEGNSNTVANLLREDVDNANHCGEYHGFEAFVATSRAGIMPVVIYAVNPSNNDSAVIGADFSANIKNFQFAVDSVEAVPGGVHITGWCYDERDIDQTLEVHTYFGGGAGDPNASGDGSTVANLPREDVDGVNNCGLYHGFDAIVYTDKTGDMPVVLYAVNPSNGESTPIYLTFSINIPSPIVYGFDEIKAVPGGVHVHGWCYDVRDINKNLEVHVYFGGAAGDPNAEGVYGGVANLERTDVDDATHCGPNHGFDMTVYTSKAGDENDVAIVVYAVNPDDGVNNVMYLSWGMKIDYPIQSDFDGFEVVPGGVKIRGWCYDARDVDQALEVHVYFGGLPGSPDAEGDSSTVANVLREDVDDARHCGTNHGFESTVYTSKRGDNVGVLVYAVNPTNGENRLIGFFGANITDPVEEDHNPEGCFDEADAYEGGVYVKGWAFDKDDLWSTLEINVYIGGSAEDANAELHKITANKQREDVDAAKQCGEYHGFEENIATDKTGEQEIYVYAINVGEGENVFIDHKTVNIPQSSGGDPEHLFGDVNNDGSVNNKDVVALFRYVLSDATDGDLSVYDINDDGKINTKDVIALFRMIVAQ